MKDSKYFVSERVLIFTNLSSKVAIIGIVFKINSIEISNRILKVLLKLADDY